MKHSHGQIIPCHFVPLILHTVEYSTINIDDYEQVMSMALFKSKTWVTWILPICRWKWCILLRTHRSEFWADLMKYAGLVELPPCRQAPQSSGYSLHFFNRRRCLLMVSSITKYTFCLNPGRSLTSHQKSIPRDGIQHGKPPREIRRDVNTATPADIISNRVAQNASVQCS
jgi:hypothetical protein